MSRCQTQLPRTVLIGTGLGLSDTNYVNINYTILLSDQLLALFPDLVVKKNVVPSVWVFGYLGVCCGLLSEMTITQVYFGNFELVYTAALMRVNQSFTVYLHVRVYTL